MPTDVTPSAVSRAAASSTARLVEGHAHAAVDGDALRHLQAPAARHQRGGLDDLDVVELVLALAPDLERVAEALGRDEPGRRALALDQGVGEERGRVHHAADVGGGDVALGQQPVDAGHHARRGVGVRGQLLVARLPAAARVVDDDIGERAADVDPQPETLHDFSPAHSAANALMIVQASRCCERRAAPILSHQGERVLPRAIAAIRALLIPGVRSPLPSRRRRVFDTTRGGVGGGVTRELSARFLWCHRCALRRVFTPPLTPPRQGEGDLAEAVGLRHDRGRCRGGPAIMSPAESAL